MTTGCIALHVAGSTVSAAAGEVVAACVSAGVHGHLATRWGGRHLLTLSSGDEVTIGFDGLLLEVCSAQDPTVFEASLGCSASQLSWALDAVTAGIADANAWASVVESVDDVVPGGGTSRFVTGPVACAVTIGWPGGFFATASFDGTNLVWESPGHPDTDGARLAGLMALAWQASRGDRVRLWRSTHCAGCA